MRHRLLKATTYSAFVVLSSLVLTISGCGTPDQNQSNGDQDSRLEVISTTSILADVVSQVGGDLVHSQVLLPLGADPHSFDPTPQDVAKVVDAQVIFAISTDLEEFLVGLLESAQAEDRVVYANEFVSIRETEDGEHHEDAQETGGRDHAEGEDAATAHVGDPHVWTDPTYVMEWVERIEWALSRVDPQHAAIYESNAVRYREELQELDDWIFSQVAVIPEANRKFVTDHMVFGYFAARYGFDQVGAIVPSFTTNAQPSAQDFAALQEIIAELDVKVVFVGNTINPALAQRLSEDTGIKLVFLYTGSLSAEDGPASNYIDFIRFNVNAIVGELR